MNKMITIATATSAPISTYAFTYSPSLFIDPMKGTVIRVFFNATNCGFSTLNGFVYFMHVGSGAATHAAGAEMNAIAASIIGGTLLTGGVGNVIGTFFGVLSLSTIQNIVASAGLDDAWWTGITIAAMLFIFLIIQSVVISWKKKAEK